jgi:uncharacterized protein YyaL (SSP411 family)
VQTRLFYDPPLPPNSTATPDPRHAYAGGFYSTEAETLSPTILRLKSGMDKAVPSTNAVAASNLFRLGTQLNEDKYILQAKETVNAFEAEILQYPWLFVGLLTSVVTARLGVRTARVGSGDEAALRAWYTRPRAEAGVLILAKGKEEEGAGTKQGSNGILEGLKKKVEDLTIGSRS